MVSWPQKHWQSTQVRDSVTALTDRNDENQAEALRGSAALRARKRKQPDDGESPQYAHDAEVSEKSSAVSVVNGLQPVAAMHDPLDEEMMVSLSHEDTGLFGDSMEAGLQGVIPSPAGHPAFAGTGGLQGLVPSPASSDAPFAGPLGLGGECGIASDAQTGSVSLASSIASVVSSASSEDKKSAGSHQNREPLATIEAFVCLAEQNNQPLRKLKSLVALDCEMKLNSTSMIGGRKFNAVDTNESSAGAADEERESQIHKRSDGVGTVVAEAAVAQNPTAREGANASHTSKRCPA